MRAADRARAAWEIAASDQCHLDTVEADDATQRRCAAVGCQGTAREWARLMDNLAPGTGLPVAARRIVREALERPSTPGDDGRFGAKAGDLPGILTFAGYLRARTGGFAARTFGGWLGDLPKLLRLVKGCSNQRIEALCCPIS